MKLYKYRDFSEPCNADFDRLATLINHQSFWCARPDTLNDPYELAWTCDYNPSGETIDLFAELLNRINGDNEDQARHQITRLIDLGYLEHLAQPIIEGMIQQCRNEIGLVCFGTSPVNKILWKRYGGNGAGVCIELDVPDNLLGTMLFRVQYANTKKIHIDQLMHAFLNRDRIGEVYALALLSKPSIWTDEEEIRFISQKQGVNVMIDGGRITCIILGNELNPIVRARIEEITGDHSIMI